MGMFDYISNSVTQRIIKTCPVCGGVFTDSGEKWQTKYFDCRLDTLQLEDLILDKFEMCHMCSDCGNFISADVDFNRGTVDIEVGHNTQIQHLLFSDLDVCHERLLALKNKIYKKLNADDEVVKTMELHQATESDLEKYRHLEDFDTIVHHLLQEYYVVPKELDDE